MISSFIYRQSLAGNRGAKKLWKVVRRLIIKIDDEALCSMRVHGRDLIMPLSHVLPLYLHELPFYDRLPARLAGFLKAKLNTVKCIDVGANIGDTIAAFKASTGAEDKHSDPDIFLAVEPSPRFRRCLNLNWGNDQSVIILPYICSSSEGDTTASINESKGTASIDFSNTASSNHDEKFQKRTIDSIVNQYKQFGDLNILKIDTDGHDFDVLAGAKDFILRSQPFIYFEVDSFSNPKFVEDCLNTLEFLCEAGYKRIFIYDNYGYLMGVFDSDDVSCIKKLLFYKLTKKSYYFDFLLMKDCFVDEFYKLEVDYFVNSTEGTELCQAV